MKKKILVGVLTACMAAALFALSACGGGNSALRWLYCGRNQLTSLNVSANPALERFGCGGNQLKSLDISGCAALQSMECSGNQLTGLDLSKNAALEDLRCENNLLTSLDVSANPALQFLWCADNQLTSLDVSACPALTELQCNWNRARITAEGGRFDLSSLPGFDVTKASNWNQGTVSGTVLYTGFSYVTYTYDCGRGYSGNFTLSVTLAAPPVIPDEPDGIPIDEAHFPDAVFREYIKQNIDKNKNEYLSDDEIHATAIILVYTSGIKSLKGIEYFTELTRLGAAQNEITEIDLSQNTKLEQLGLNTNRLTSIDLSHNPNLWHLSIQRNQLAVLDLRTCPQLVNTVLNGEIERQDAIVIYRFGGDLQVDHDVTLILNDEPVQPDLLPGDVGGDGVLDGRDLLRLARYIAGNAVAIQEKNADVNGDGAVDGRDLIRLARYLAGEAIALQ
mgnify:CR=1 FL=1